MSRFRSRAELRAIFAKIGQMQHTIREARTDYQSDERIIGGIRKAVAEWPGRLTHGHTNTNAFYLTDDGRVIPFNEAWKTPPPPGTAISVHSHTGDSGGDEEHLFFSPGDVHSFLRSYRRGLKGEAVPWSKATALITRDGRLHVMRIGPETHLKSVLTYARMNAKKFDDLLMKPAHIPGKGYSVAKIAGSIKQFAADLGIEYKELRWK